MDSKHETLLYLLLHNRDQSPLDQVLLRYQLSSLLIELLLHQETSDDHFLPGRPLHRWCCQYDSPHLLLPHLISALLLQVELL